MRFIRLIFVISMAVTLQSCQNKPGVWKNEQISPGKIADFHELNKQLFTSLQADDPKQLGFLESKELLGDSYINRQVDLISNSLKTRKYKILDEYYVVNSYMEADTIKASSNDINAHKLIYSGTTHEMYMAFFVSDDPRDKWLITAVYCKYDYGWKLNSLDLAMYTINGKTPPELFKLAQEEYAKNYFVDAISVMRLAQSILRPNQMWLYLSEGDISKFYYKTLNEANAKYKFPIVLSDIPTHPRIFRVFSSEVKDGYYPHIHYLSSIKLSDTVALKKENELVKKEIGNIFTGLDKDNDYILYTIFNEMPSSLKSVDRFEILDKLK